MSGSLSKHLAANGEHDHSRGTLKVSDMVDDLAGPVATPSPSSHTKIRSLEGITGTPKAQMAVSLPVHCSVENIASRLKEYSKDIRHDHSQMVAHAIESTVATERRVFTGRDLFASLRCKAVPQIKGQTMSIKSKLYLPGTKAPTTMVQHFNVLRIRTNKDAVPSYRFPHIEVKKNILAANSTLAFVPHVRDLEPGSETIKYEAWLKELEDTDRKCGFNPMTREEKRNFLIHSERAATMSLYLELWLSRLAIPSCNKSALVRYLASQESNDATTPPQKGDNLLVAPDAMRAAEIFTEAFELAFAKGQPPSNVIVLRQVLSRELRSESFKSEKLSSPQHDNIYEAIESKLGTYGDLGCSICFSHSCDHGDFDSQNQRRSVSLCSPLSDILKRKRAISSTVNSIVKIPCTQRCHRLGSVSDLEGQQKEWTKDEHILLQSIYVASDHSKLTLDPICLVANFLDRNCYDVYTEFLHLDISRPQLKPTVQQKPPSIGWYDHSEKRLFGKWQAKTVSHDHQRREIVEPCFHDGPCMPKICSCVDARVLCERLCGCTEDTCSYKFTGCACHSQGKTCIAKQKDKPCICVQLNRECDPQLCGSCGALDHADPLNADDVDLHSTGCQNCELQRGVHKSLLLGQSQLDGVGYGLFTAEDIARGEFVIEYVGELITHDEGVRREARRGDPFDEKSNVSYMFTLLEKEGFWVDAAVFGNLSRYINHAEDEARGCNLTPRILYVNGEYRIKFTALRHIKAGEELFFNYGKHFPHLTQKLVDNKAGEKADGANPKVGRPRGAMAGDRVARKTPRSVHLRGGSSKLAQTLVQADSPLLEEEGITASRESGDDVVKTRKRKRAIRNGSTDDEFHPTVANCRTAVREDWSENDSKKAAYHDARRPGRNTRSHRDTEEASTPLKMEEDPLKLRVKRRGAR